MRVLVAFALGLGPPPFWGDEMYRPVPPPGITPEVLENARAYWSDGTGVMEPGEVRFDDPFHYHTDWLHMERRQAARRDDDPPWYGPDWAPSALEVEWGISAIFDATADARRVRPFLIPHSWETAYLDMYLADLNARLDVYLMLRDAVREAPLRWSFEGRSLAWRKVRDALGPDAYARGKYPQPLPEWETP